MRCIGSVNDAAAAQRFVDYLSVAGIPAVADAAGPIGPTSHSEPAKWEIWVKEEDKVERAKAELAQFLEAPTDSRYAAAPQQARQLRQQAQVKAEQVRRNWIDVRVQWSSQGLGATRVTNLLIGLSVAIFVFGQFGHGDGPHWWRWLEFADPPVIPGMGSVWRNVLRGEIWRLFTPALLHFGVLHILFNVYVTYMLGGLIERRMGTWPYLGLVLFAAAFSNALQAQLGGTSTFGGLSGVGYALFGYAWMKSVVDPMSGYRLTSDFVFIMLAVLGLGIISEVSGQTQGFFSGVANWAHLGGFVAGLIVALFQRPR